MNASSELVCRPAKVFDFLKSYPSGISSQTLSLGEIEFMYTYFLEEEPTGNAQEVSLNQFLDRFLRPQS